MRQRIDARAADVSAIKQVYWHEMDGNPQSKVGFAVTEYFCGSCAFIYFADEATKFDSQTGRPLSQPYDKFFHVLDKDVHTAEQMLRAAFADPEKRGDFSADQTREEIANLLDRLPNPAASTFFASRARHDEDPSQQASVALSTRS